MEIYHVDRIWLHKPAWNCHVDCVPVVRYDAALEQAQKTGAGVAQISAPYSQHNGDDEMTTTLLSKKATGKLVIAILDRGWVFIGRATEGEHSLQLESADCVRRWGTTKGIGQLALEGKQSETVLDPAGSLSVPKTSVIALIDARESSWPGR